MARAAYFEGNVEVEGKLKTGPAGSSLPIAYGTASASGTLLCGTDNVSSKWNAVSQNYEVTISGYTYNTYDYVTLVTPAAALPKFAAAYADAYGRLLVIIHDWPSARTQSDFHFVTYKP